MGAGTKELTRGRRGLPLDPHRAKHQWRGWMFAYLMILPSLGLTFVFTLLPLIETVYHSFFRGQLLSPSTHFIGLKNYVDAWTTGGGAALLVTLKYSAGFLLVTTVLGLLVAILLNLRVKGISIFRTVFIIPLVIPIVATAIVWLTVFNQFFGLVDRALQVFHLPAVNWFSPRTALLSVVMFSSWQYLGQDIILSLAALKSLPSELLEAARVDGATPFQRFRLVVLPLLMPSLTLIIVIGTITALQTFTQVDILTSGGPINATTTAAYYIYNQAFNIFNTGNAEALATILFLITIGITIFQMKVLRRMGSEGYEKRDE